MTIRADRLLPRRWFGACCLGIFSSLGFIACAKVLGDFTLAGPSGAGGSAGNDAGPIRDAGARDMGLVPEAAEAGCPEGATICQGLAVLTCSNGAFRQTSTCPFVCTAGSCTGICTPNDKSCQGSVLRTCKADGTWNAGMSCPSSLCTGGEGTDAGPAHCSGVCTPGSTTCKTATTLSACDENGTYQDMPCLYVCIDSGQSAACGGMCAPNSKQCDGNQPQLCSLQGQWIVNGNPCPTPMVCVAGSCTGMCVNGSTQCNGRTVQNCVNGAWVDSASPCSFACYGGACTTCAPGSTSCNGNALDTCTADGGSSLASCPFVCRDGGCTGVCNQGSLRCAGDGGLTIQTCTTEGEWLSEGTCAFSCMMGVCQGECIPGRYRCNPSTNGPEVCDVGGSWVSNGSCPAGCNVDAGVCAAANGGG